jgi:hypothetical protein
MKQELKFRAWDNDYHKMVKSIVCETFELGISFEGVVIGFEQENSTKDKPASVGIFPARFTPMQFTGLKDQSGKEIYEGDILNNLSGNKYKVVFEYGSFMKQHIMEFHPTGLLSEVNLSFWVVGNIYENPELLEQDTLCACKEFTGQHENLDETVSCMIGEADKHEDQTKLINFLIAENKKLTTTLDVARRLLKEAK